MIKTFSILLFLFFCASQINGQNKLDIKAKFNIESKTVDVTQVITYKNTSQDTLSEIYLHDWSNSYSTKTTPLANRFTEEFDNRFHFAKSRDRGFTVVTAMNQNGAQMEFQYVKDHPDVIKAVLNRAILPGQSYTINLEYMVTMPNSSFTDYGIDGDNNIYLKYWYLTPAVYDGQWQYYSNKDLEDLFIPVSNISMEIEYPKNYLLISELNTWDIYQGEDSQISRLAGEDRINSTLILTRFPNYRFVQTDKFTVVTNIDEDEIEQHEKAIVIDKIVNFITENLGEYPHETMLVTQTEYNKDQLYGLNQLPELLRPFSDAFQYELKVLKTALQEYLDNNLITNPRKDYWLNDGLQIYFLIKYIEEFYPDKKLLGSLADVWGVRSFHAADLGFNERYTLFYMEMARTNKDQPLVMPKDSLIKFNANIAGKYKAGIGLKYLDDFINEDILENTIKEYLDENRLRLVKTGRFEEILKKHTDKDIDWFFNDYLKTRVKMDFKIKSIERNGDSLNVTIKNIRKNSMPVSLFRVKEDSIISKEWIENISGEKVVTIPRNEADKLVLNYDQTIPEYNLRNNWKSLKGAFFNNKPLQFRLFKDFEDPNYSQVFLMPLVEFNNIYDGLTLGAKLYNKTILRKGFNYKFSPQFATRSKSFTGGGSVFYRHEFENQELYSLAYGFGAKYNSIAEDAFVTVLTPNISLFFRDDDDFRSNRRKYLNLRYLSIKRTLGDNASIVIDEPDYSILNLRYIDSDNNLTKFNRWYGDLQFGQDFGKLSINYEYRKLTESNRNFNFRFFAGTFLYNDTDVGSDYFSFALDRPTDYLFDYNYLGRAESTGLFSQQIIIAEGGFKSQLPTEFANQWMTTMNGGFSIWRYIEVYGDIGLLKNKSEDANFVYDSGLRLNLVPDYFEVFFPVYSNLGWEIAQRNYDQKIRFKITVDPEVLLGLFKRKWY